MKERPILFAGPMVRAILDGRKTQTRRVVKDVDADIVEPVDDDYWRFTVDGGGAYQSSDLRCPYGVSGDRLWVRETHCAVGYQAWAYRATGDWIEREKKWKPSIHMPRRASRITLEITDVRVERLHELTKEDAIAEGIEETGHERTRWKDYSGLAQGLLNPVNSFATLWDSINEKTCPWSSNPWVWVVEFKMVQ